MPALNNVILVTSIRDCISFEFWLRPEVRFPSPPPSINDIHILSETWARPMTSKTSELKVHADFPLGNKNPKLRSCVLFREQVKPLMVSCHFTFG